MKQRLVHLGQLTSFFLFLVSFSIAFTINFSPLYRFDIDSLNVLLDTNLTKPELMSNYHQLMHYLNNPFIGKLQMSDFPTSVSGANHFADVKQLFLLDYAILIVTAIITFFFLRRLKRTGKLWQLWRPCVIAVFIPLIIAFLMAVNFDQFFVGFHEVFFRNSDWLFDAATDPIITVLPEEFFMHCFILAVVLIEILFVIGIIVGRHGMRHKSTFD